MAAVAEGAAPNRRGWLLRVVGVKMELPQQQAEQAGSTAAQSAKAPPRLMLSKPKPAVEAQPEPKKDVDDCKGLAAAATDVRSKGGEGAPEAAAPSPAEEIPAVSSERQVRPPASLQASRADGAAAPEAPPALGLNPKARGPRDNSELEVDWVVAKRTGKGGVEYKVRWLGYGNANDTWEPVINLTNARGKVADFELREKRRVGAAQGKSTWLSL